MTIYPLRWQFLTHHFLTFLYFSCFFLVFLCFPLIEMKGYLITDVYMTCVLYYSRIWLCFLQWFCAFVSMEIKVGFIKLSSWIYSLNLILMENSNKTKILTFQWSLLILLCAIFKWIQFTFQFILVIRKVLFFYYGIKLYFNNFFLMPV